MIIHHVLAAAGPLLSAGLALASPAPAAAQTLPFTVELVESPWHGAPPLQGFAVAQTDDGKWLCIGGRTTGLHGVQEAGEVPGPGSNFKRLNDRAWLIDPGESARSKSLAELAGDLAESLAVTNAPFAVSDGLLYIVGGYGLLTDSELRNNATYDRLTVIDVEATAQAIMNDEPAGVAIRQSEPHHFLQVTGGGLAIVDDVFYLVFGQNFTGNYTEQANGQYTHQVRTFTVGDDGVNDPIVERGLAYGSEATHPSFRRRDLNLAPARAPNGELRLAVYGGVFTRDGGVWRSPIYIDPARMGDPVEDPSFEQQMCQYECGVVPMWSEATRTVYTLFPGGISDTYYTSAGFVRDRAAPFIRQVTCIRREADGTSREFLVTAPDPASPEGTSLLQLPALLGASARFIPIESKRYEDGILNLDEVPPEPTLVGHLYGGIRAVQPNGNFGASHASDLIFEVYVARVPSDAIPVVAP